MNELITCPQCGKKYEPELKNRDPNRYVQDQFPDSSPIQREQHITGLCSDKCWDEYVGLER